MSILSAGTTNSTALNLTADTSGSLILASNNGTTAITVSTSQNVGIGTSSPTQKLQVAGNAFISAGQYFMWDNAGAWALQSDASTYVRTLINGNEQLRVNAYGIGIGGITPSSGTGVTFPATQNASSDANTLDDYEEGTWTPSDNSGAGLSLTISGATYVKVGQIVTAYCQINYPSTANGNGAAIAGLPFTVAGQDIYGGFTRYSTYGYVYPTLAQSGTYGSLYTTTGAQITNSNLSSKRVDLTYVYRSNA